MHKNCQSVKEHSKKDKESDSYEVFKEVVIVGMWLHGTALGHCQLQHSFIAKCDRSFEERGSFSPHVIYVLNTQTRERIYFLELVHKGVPSSFADQIFAEKWFADWAVTPLQTVCKVDNGKGVKKDWKWIKKG